MLVSATPRRAALRGASARAIALWLCAATIATAAGPPPRKLVHVAFPGPDEVASWIEKGYDVWSVHPDQGVIMALTPGQERDLGRAGVAVGDPPVPLQGTPRWYQCYRTGPEAKEWLQRMAAEHPGLAEVRSVGPTWETVQGAAERYLWALRLTNSRVAGPKPKLLVLGLHHAREIVTPEAVLGLADRLLTEQAASVDVAWLLDATEIWLVPMVNPDGHVRAVSRQDWRKNADADYCGQGRVRDGDGPGVDLNRNYGFRWGGAGASTEPCDRTYHGPGAFSEPESAAVRELIGAEDFDLVVSLHAFSGLVLYPWGYTKAPAPDADGLTALAAALAEPMGYEARQASGLYVTSGTTCDWVYGSAGIPCVTFEIGTQRDGGFWPSCAVRSRLADDAVEALLLAVRFTPEPLALALGPKTSRVRVAAGATEALVTASLDTPGTRSGSIAAAELFFDILGPPGTGMAMEVSSRMGRGSASLVVALRDAPRGGHYVLVRAADDRGRWGPAAAGWLMNGAAATATPLPPTAAASATPVTPGASATASDASRPRRLLLPALPQGPVDRAR